jgi:glucose-1-phosphate cytidylyltransferase
MKTIILCGGVGTRLKEETEFKPKPMVYVGDKPIIWHIMKIYAHYGFNEFILALGYKSDYIKDFFLNQKAFTTDFSLETKNHSTKFFLKARKEVDDFKITFVDTGLETLPGERILKCKNFIPKNDLNFMVTYGDGVANVDIQKILRFHKSQKTVGTVTGVHPRTKYGLLKINQNNLVTEITEKPVLSDWVNGGFMVFTKKIFNYLNKNEYEHEAIKRLADIKQLSIYKHNGFWFAVDTYKELEDLNVMWKRGKPLWKIWK